MRFLRSAAQCVSGEIKRDLEEAVVGAAIGNFDGMHAGHQVVFNKLQTELKRLAAGRSLPARTVLVTFAPHPRVALSGLSGAELDKSPRYWTLNSLSQKIVLAERFGFDYFFVVKFTKELAALSPEEFVERVLKRALQASLVVVGFDWRFGRGRSGTPAVLTALGEKAGFQVEVVPQVDIDGHRVSSSTVKEALARGDLATLQKLLGRRFAITGKTKPGAQRGRILGYPTANLEPKRTLLPPDGVYASLVHIVGEVYPAVTNIGVRPTFTGEKRHLVETHLLRGGEKANYGTRIEVEFVEKLRDEVKYESADALRRQIARDAEAAAKLLAETKS